MPDANPTLEESLTRAIKSVKDKIKRDSSGVTGANEVRTRHALIDPILRALGWEDPSVITPEYTVSHRPRPFRNTHVDYALHQPDDRGAVIAFIEAKKMRTDLTDEHHKQVFKYAQDRDVSLYILTNGDQWELYEKGKSHPITFSIRKQSASECARLFLCHFPLPDNARRTSNDSTPSPVSAMDVILSSEPATEVDMRKALAYFVFCFTSSILIGWNTGYWSAKPRSIRLGDDLVLFIGYILFCMLAIVLAATVVHLLFQYPKSKKETDVWRLIPLFMPINGDRLITLYWIVIATVGGVGVGGLSGFFLGKLLGEFLDTLSPLLVFTGILTLYVLLALLPSLLKRVFRNKQKAR